MKKIFTFVFFFFYSLCIVHANTINNIDMDVYIDKNGDALIEEKWDATLDTGTEGYRIYSKLGNSYITDFSVSDDTGVIYKNIENWNVKSSFNNKIHKSSILYTSNGIELVWGISNYGDKTYTLKYRINRFVTQYTDTQGIYFNFFNLDQNIGNVNIKIHSDTKFSIDNSKIWGFGNNGSINFVDGNIIYNSNGTLASNQYMTALIKFESNIFNTDSKVMKTFDEIKEEAFGKTKKIKFKDILPFIKLFAFSIFIGFIPYIMYLITPDHIIPRRKSRKKEMKGEYDFGEGGTNLPKLKNIDYQRDIPCNKDIAYAYFIISSYEIASYSKSEQGLIGAILLKWLKKGYITIEKLGKRNYEIDFSKMEQADNPMEEEMYQLFKMASNAESKLEFTRFKYWIKKNYSFAEARLNKARIEAEQHLIDINIIKDSNKAFDPKFREEAIKILGLKKYLLNFSNIEDKGYEDVHLWENYLIFANLLGIAKKVSKQFKKVYPDFNFNNNPDIPIFLAMSDIVNFAYGAMDRQISKEYAFNDSKISFKDYQKEAFNSSDRDFGGGGSSYSGGGSSAGGSSGGGFR